MISTSVFVFGSNLRGIHGAGAALSAVHFHGAQVGLGVGLQGGSYAIPTCSLPGTPLPLDVVRLYVLQFAAFVDIVKATNWAVMFKVTRVGCGYAGFKDEQMAPLFNACDPSMCQFDASWQPWLKKRYSYWIRT